MSGGTECALSEPPAWNSSRARCTSQQVAQRSLLVLGEGKRDRTVSRGSLFRADAGSHPSRHTSEHPSFKHGSSARCCPPQNTMHSYVVQLHTP